jgi:hypothetical protein
MPVADIEILVPGESISDGVQARAWIDTGYPYTIIPHGHLSTLKMKRKGVPSGAKPIFDGTSKQETFVPSYWISISVPIFGVIIENVEVMTEPIDYGVLGRDFLNKIRLLLDGPVEQWIILID